MSDDQLFLEKEIKKLEPYCAGFHLDVMDNKFVPNKALAIDQVNAIAKITKKVWVHLMVEKPDTFYDAFFLPVGSLVSFHIESEVDVFEFIKIIREKKHKASIAISPKTPVSELIPFLDNIDQILVMSVEPGFSGQTFLKSSYEKITELVALRKQYNNFRIGIDGGINATNIKTVIEKGVDDCAASAAIFQQDDHVAALQQLQKLVML